jgi:hypothetical protein
MVGGALAEVLVGFRMAPDVGPMVVLSTGGVLAEIFADTSVRLAPVTVDQAREMIAEVKGLALVRGYRSSPRGDLDALARAVAAMSGLARDPGGVVEAEANPVLVLPEGRGVVAVDALVRESVTGTGDGMERRAGAAVV